MPDTWDSLTAEQKAARVATDAMGWHESRGPSGEPEWRYKSVARACSVKDFCPTEKIEQAWEVQEHVCRTDKVDSYLDHLLRLCLGGDFTSDIACATWHAATASADQRCHAAVLAVGGMNDA